MFNIAFVSSALSPDNHEDRESFDFFAVMLGGVVRAIQDQGWRISVYIPQKQGPDSSDQRDILRKVLLDVAREEGRFDGIIVAPFETNGVVEEFETFFESLTKPPRLPVVFLDKHIDVARFKKKPDNIVISNVTCNNYEGGKFAAQILHDNFDSRAIPQPRRRFMMLAGLEGSEDRLKGFTDELVKTYLYDEAMIMKPSSAWLDFSRGGASRWMDLQFNLLLKGLPNSFSSLAEGNSWGLFACNDEMALGLRKYISNRFHQQRQKLERLISLGGDGPRVEDIAAEYSAFIFLQNVRIVGFDGISSAIDLIKPVEQFSVKDPWLVGTVSAQIKQQTSRAVQWMEQFLSGGLSSPMAGGPIKTLKVMSPSW